MNPSPAEPTNDYLSSGMSELDSWSDSDWLDIPSGNASEDNDSISSRDTHSRPLSRRSSFSLGSSREGDIEAWEGYAYDSHDEAAANLASGMYPLPNATLAGSTDLQRVPLDLIPNIETELDRAEDERVKEALEQSLIGTLSASRSSTTGAAGLATSGTTHSQSTNSAPNLRLSFPDPLTSSRNELTRSYDDVSPPQSPKDDGREQLPTESVSKAGEDAAAASPDQSPDPTQPSATITVREDEAQEVVPPKVDLEIHLYGSSTEYKWALVQDLLQKVADGSGQFLGKPLDPGAGLVQTVRLENDDEDSKGLINVVKIFDRTEDNKPPIDAYDDDAPSLGIVFLPALRLPPLALHDFYLPVMARNELLDLTYEGSIPAMRQAAEDDWELLCIPSFKAFPIKDGKYSVATHDGICGADSAQVREAMEVLVTGIPKKPVKSEPSTPVNAVTIFALVSLIVGFACNTSFHSNSPIPTKTVNLTTPNNTWIAISPGPNRSNSHPLHHTNVKTSAAITSLKDVALSVYIAGSTSLSLTSQIKSLVPTSSQSPAILPCIKCSTEAALAKPITRDVVVAPSSSVALAECPMPPSPSPSKALAVSEVDSNDDSEDVQEDGEEDILPEPTTKALGLKFVDSLSEALGVTKAAVIKSVNDETNDLFDSLDDLLSSIRTQTDELIKNSKGKARAFGEQVQNMGETLQYRNDRARSRAKELKKKGEEFIWTASERVKQRTDIAKKRAYRIRRSLEESDAWKVYQARRMEWDDGYEDAWKDTGTWGIHSSRGCAKVHSGRAGRLRSFSCD